MRIPQNIDSLSFMELVDLAEKLAQEEVARRTGGSKPPVEVTKTKSLSNESVVTNQLKGGCLQ